MRLRILAVTSEPPWPLDSGGHLRSFHLLRALGRQFDLRLYCPVSEQQYATTRELTAAGVTTVGVHVPARSTLTELGGLAASAIGRRPYVMYGRHGWPIVTQALDREYRLAPPDVLYLDHLDSAWHLERLQHAKTASPTAVIDLHNIYSLLARRTGDEERRLLRRYALRREASLLERAEADAVRHCDVTLAVSEVEAQHFRHLGARDVHVAPNGVDVEKWAALPTGRNGESIILFLGVMSWPPNVEAAKYLATAVLPVVRQTIAGARLVVVGRQPTADVQALASLPGVEVAGHVPDVAPYLTDSAVLAVPLESGGGTRLKVLEAFAAGLPVVSTPVGIEGIRAEPGLHFVEAKRDRFAQALVAVLSDRTMGQRCAAAARELVRHHYDWNAIGEVVTEAIRTAVARKGGR